MKEGATQTILEQEAILASEQARKDSHTDSHTDAMAVGCKCLKRLVGAEGFEPPTSCSQSRTSEFHNLLKLSKLLQ